MQVEGRITSYNVCYTKLLRSITVIYTIVSLSALGVVAAVILYFVAQKFKVEEDPRIDEVEGMLPGANCGVV